MAFDAMKDGDPWGPMCRSCKRPIDKGQPMENIRFEVDPDGKLEDLNGPYHAVCARPFQSMARIINMKPFGL
jgi:hypothetical protein